MNKYLFLAVISLAAANNSVAKNSAPDNQCVSINIPAFNLMPDESCSVSSDPLILSKLPDQVFVYNLGLPAEDTCFTIVNSLFPGQGYQSPEIIGTLTGPEPGQEMNIIFSGVAGLTVSTYFPIIPTDQPYSFTAATLVSIATDDTDLGQLVTRDAGTIFPNDPLILEVNIPPIKTDFAKARLSIVKGTGKFKGVSGYIDETGMEFNPLEPANANGILCGKGLADDLFLGSD